MARYENFTVGNLYADNIMPKLSTSSGAGLSPEIWDGMPIGSMLSNPTLGTFIGDDFNAVQATGFPYTLAGTNGTAAKTAGTAFGALTLSAPGTDNDEAYYTYQLAAGSIIANKANDWAFEARVKISQIATAQGVFVGLSEETGVGVDFMTDNTMAIKVIDGIGFQIIAATDVAAVWQSAMWLNGGARVAINATLNTPAAATYQKLGMKSVGGVVSFYVNGVKNSTTVASTATNFPLDQVMCPNFATKCGSAAANTLIIDWWYAAQLR